MIQIIIFEDEKFRQFLPLSYLRAIFDLKLGTSTLEDKIIDRYPNTPITYWVRNELIEYLKETFPNRKVNIIDEEPEMFLGINGRLAMKDVIPLEGDEEIVYSGNDVVYFRIKGETLHEHRKSYLKDPDDKIFSDDVFKKLFQSVRQDENKYRLLNYPWEFIPINGEWIDLDFKKKFSKFKPESIVVQKCRVTGPIENLWLAQGIKIENFIEFNTEGGPIIVEEGTEIHSFTRIEGPAYIGKNCRLLGAKIRAGTSLFDNCRIGGEVEESIFLGNSNHYHHGFIGHSVVGEWVNIGALTATSDLKNNYGKIRMVTPKGMIQTDQIKIGSIIGDFTKFGIGTLLNTGSIIGISANVFGGGIQPKFIPSFTWGGGETWQEYDPHKGVETNRAIMKRRKVEFTDALEKLYLKCFEETDYERKYI